MAPARSTSRRRSPLGTVAFVGAGPGDPGLLTVRAVEVLARADVVVLERPEHRSLLHSCRPEVEILDAACGEDGQPLSQVQRARLVTRAAKGARLVVRLMSGDPGTFNGLSEEAAACAKLGVPIEIVPGVSAVSGVPAYAGVPLTSSAARRVHVLPGAGAETDWGWHAAADTTLVLLGDEREVSAAAQALVGAGRDPQTPVAVTADGTTSAQRTLISTLERVASELDTAGLGPRLVTVVGDVVAVREQLSWYETKPLFGWRVLVPRTKDQAAALTARLRAHGAVPEEVPTISVEPPRNPQQMERAIRGLVEGRYEWIAFTSVNALKAVRERLQECGRDARALSGLKGAAVGERTAEGLQAWGITPDLVPGGEQSAQGLVADWPPYDDVLDPIDRVFLPRADIATETLVAGLRELGWEVDDVTAYRTVRAAPPAAAVREAIKAGRFDAAVFTSSSTVRNLVGIAGKPHPATVVACIGPQTARTAEDHGLHVDVIADSPSAEALADALAEHGAAHRRTVVEPDEVKARPSDKRRSASKHTAT